MAFSDDKCLFRVTRSRITEIDERRPPGFVYFYCGTCVSDGNSNGFLAKVLSENKKINKQKTLIFL